MRAEEYQAEVMRALHQCREKIREQMDAYSRNASRKAVKSLEVRPDPEGATLWGVKYFDTMQHGRPAGPVPRDFAKTIYLWSLDKGIELRPMPYRNGKGKYSPEERARWNFARAVAHRIEVSGTLLHRRHGYNDIYDTAVQTAVAEVANTLLVKATSDIDEIQGLL